MKISDIKTLLDAEVLCGEELLNTEVFSACCSDMMSDVLAYVKDQGVLLTGLVNPQVVRTAEMMDMVCVVFVRNKRPSLEMIELAADSGIVLLATKRRAFEASGLLYSGKSDMADVTFHFDVDGADFSSAGEASVKVKKKLRQLGVSPDVIRKVSIAMYEGEINMVIHAEGGVADVTVTDNEVVIVLADKGPGIPDVALAMKEGYSTARDNIRALGFGAGMGLPNMKKYTDSMKIDTEVGVGTTITMTVNL